MTNEQFFQKFDALIVELSNDSDLETAVDAHRILNAMLLKCYQKKISIISQAGFEVSKEIVIGTLTELSAQNNSMAKKWLPEFQTN